MGLLHRMTAMSLALAFLVAFFSGFLDNVLAQKGTCQTSEPIRNTTTGEPICPIQEPYHADVMRCCANPTCAPAVNVSGNPMCPMGTLYNMTYQLCCTTSGQPILPGTNGTGNGTTNATCVDQASPGRGSDCSANSNLCNEPLYYDLMTAQCPKTCNRCGVATNFTRTPGCRDNYGVNGVSNCAENAFKCTLPIWRTFMQMECPSTCGLCNGTSTNGTTGTNSTPEIIEYYGYPVEVVETTTDDGYILTMHRIPFGVKNDSDAVISKKRPVVFLQHGLLGSSSDWVTNLPNQSAGFIFADAGFDVWMGNVRGNYYSQRHVNLSTSDRAFWQFTWDEMANYDIPAMVDAVLSITEQPFVYYVGHSQGTEIMFAKLASDPKFNAKVRKFFALAPVAAVGHIRGFFAWLADHFGSDLRILTKIFGTHEFLPHTWITKLFSVILCGPKFMNPLCDNVLFQIGGPESNQFNQTRLVVYLSHTPAGTSTCNVVHWAQMAVKKKIQKFDYGTPEENRQHYGQDTPPVYNLSNVNAPVYLYYSDADWLADVADIQARKQAFRVHF
ncbi:CBN-LIPL-6 protein [Aphelenchoides avenae]|nr:CBN-LIPL-6 protein [Aphelenchus avenae]